jgi:hypothetical protein
MLVNETTRDERNKRTNKSKRRNVKRVIQIIEMGNKFRCCI